MALIASHATDPRPRGAMSPETALRYAWVFWLGLLLFPAMVFLYVVWALMGDGVPATAHQASSHWFLGAMAYMVIAVPLAIFWRSHLFKSYWQGEVVDPSAYLRGMMIVWIALEIGGLLGLTGCLVTRGFLPNLIPAVVAFVLFLPLWPSGRSMVTHVGNHDDPGTYEEPR